MNRREFLKGSAWMGAAAFAAGCVGTKGFGFGDGGKMATWADKPFEKLRIGLVGLGRGTAALPMCQFPGVEFRGICDLNPVRIKNAMDEIMRHQSVPPRVYTDDPEAWKRMCDSEDIDLIYNATPWELHVPIALYAMRAGKHVVTEVPSAFTIDECWELVETSEKLQRHCMQLENCCYGENELLALNLCRLGILGETVHGEGAYIHDLRGYNYADWDNNKMWDNGYWNFWRLRHNAKHNGNQYPTHGLGPICFDMNINRGDRFDYLVSLESHQRNFTSFAKAAYPGTWKANLEVAMGDMNTTLIKTKRGKSIMVQHDVSSPRPYSRINTITGTKGILTDYPLRMGWEERPGDGVHAFFDEQKAAKMRQEYMHPLWKQAGGLALKFGGHDGMDFLMVLRLAYCLKNGLPLDQNVYDLAAWCSLCELSEYSVNHRSATVDIPDFTRGGWETTAPVEIGMVDLAKMGFDA